MRTARQLVDIMNVPVEGDPAGAIVETDGRAARGLPRRCDLLIVGGGTGGSAAAIAAVRAGLDVCLTEETDWLGGQFSAQGVSALDEHEHIEHFGGTARYYEFRDRIRADYLSFARSVDHWTPFNPGNCWVTSLAFEPKVASRIVGEMLERHSGSGRAELYFRTKPFTVIKDGPVIQQVSCINLETKEPVTFEPRFVIDATELGDLLELAEIDHVVGAESIVETGETGAHPAGHYDSCVQSYTYTFALERGPVTEVNTIPKPARYDLNKSRQPYSLEIEVHGGEIYGEESGRLRYSVFEKMPATKGSLWTYRRLIDVSQFDGFLRDITMINWPGNDYRDGNLLTSEPLEVATALQEAKLVSLGFLYWLQTEAPAETGRGGASELRLRRDVMGTSDGLSKFPYIRESRRIRALRTVKEQDVSAKFQHGLRGAHFADSIGIGWYPIDIHRSTPEEVGTSARTKPFQIPLGALLPRETGNLVAGAKNLGTTHITNGCYRLHPVEWNVGEAAGHLCAFATKHDRSLRDIHDNPRDLRAFHEELLAAGIPIAWRSDVGVRDPRFGAAQLDYMSNPETFADRL